MKKQQYKIDIYKKTPQELTHPDDAMHIHMDPHSKVGSNNKLHSKYVHHEL